MHILTSSSCTDEGPGSDGVEGPGNGGVEGPGNDEVEGPGNNDALQLMAVWMETTSFHLRLFLSPLNLLKKKVYTAP